MRIIVNFGFCVFLVAAVNGQLKSISEAEFDKATKKAFRKVESTIRRTISEEITYRDTKIDTIRILTKESFHNGDERWEFVTTRDKKVIEKLQIIYLGKYEYRKVGDAEWTKRCVRDCSSTEKAASESFTLPAGRELPKVQQFLMLPTTVDGKQVTLYHFYRVYQSGSTLNFYERKLWIDTNGLIIAEDSTSSDVMPSILKSREVVKYQYDPKDIVPLTAPIK